MSNTSQKHRNFVSESMGEKPVTELAGIGRVLGKRLEALGYDKASTLLGKYLILKKDQELFEMWLRLEVNANSKQASDCFQCLIDWCHTFL